MSAPEATATPPSRTCAENPDGHCFCWQEADLPCCHCGDDNPPGHDLTLEPATDDRATAVETILDTLAEQKVIS